MEEINNNPSIKDEHTRITLPSFLYVITIVAFLCIIVLGYNLRMTTKKTNERLTRLEENTYNIQNSSAQINSIK